MKTARRGVQLFLPNFSLTPHEELPQPQSGFLDRLRATTTTTTSSGPAYERPTTPPPQTSPLQEPNSARSRRTRRESLGGLESDPWGSPDLHRNHHHETVTADQGIVNGYGSVRSTTNAWGGKVAEGTSQGDALQPEPANGRSEAVPPSSSGSGWGGTLHGQPVDDGGFVAGQRPGLNDFGPPGEDPSDPAPRRRSLGIPRTTNPQVEEIVTITLLPEKEGLFMFQHRNYEVKSARRGSTVVRRYSDFVWLLDCLQKRFPFRQLPLLPPKRVSGTYYAG